MSINTLLAAVLLLDFMILAASRVARCIQLAAFQGVLLALVLLAMHENWPLHVLLMAFTTAAIKGAVIPFLLARANHRMKGAREPRPYLGYTPCLLLGAVGMALAFLLARKLPLEPGVLGTFFVPASLTTLFAGFLLLITRRHALAQVVGYLTLENGVYLFSLLLVKHMPLLVESGLLLDLVVGIFVMGVVLNHIHQAFDSHDVHRLARLKD